MAKLLGYDVDLTFTNTPRISVRAMAVDPLDGVEKRMDIMACDDSARACCDAKGCVDLAALSAFIDAHLAEAEDPKSLAAAAEKLSAAKAELAAISAEIAAKAEP